MELQQLPRLERAPTWLSEDLSLAASSWERTGSSVRVSFGAQVSRRHHNGELAADSDPRSLIGEFRTFVVNSLLSCND